jgi:hypothetical protein
MPLTERQILLAVTKALAHDNGDEELLMSLADHMGTFT